MRGKIRDEKIIKTLGKRVRYLREQKKISQEELASRAKISLSQVTRIETGRLNTTICTINALVNALELELHVLLKTPKNDDK